MTKKIAEKLEGVTKKGLKEADLIGNEDRSSRSKFYEDDEDRSSRSERKKKSIDVKPKKGRKKKKSIDIDEYEKGGNKMTKRLNKGSVLDYIVEDIITRVEARSRISLLAEAIREEERLLTLLSANRKLIKELSK